MKRVGPKGSGQFVRVSWAEALGDIAIASCNSIAARDPQAIVPYSYAGTMGLVQSESMAARFFNRIGASLLDRTICSSAGGEALVATYGGKIGMHLEFYAESKLILIWGSNSIASNLHFWTFAQAAKRNGAKLICIDPRKTETADKCHQHIALLPGTDGALALGVMHELIRNDWLDHDYIAQHVDTAGWPATARTRAGVAARARGRGLRHFCRRGARPGARLRHDATRRDPPELRHAARARRRQRGARLIAILPCIDRRVAPSRRRHAAVQLRLVQGRAQRRGFAAARPARRPTAAHDQHEHDRGRPAACRIARRSVRRSKR